MRMRRWVTTGAAVTLGFGVAMTVSSAIPPTTIYESPTGWTNQFGSGNEDSLAKSNAIARSPSGDYYVAGSTEGAFPNYTAGGFSDVYLAKFDKNGNQKWVVQFGLGGNDTAGGVAVSSAGDIYVVGTTDSDLDGAGPAPFGGYDVFVARYDKNGVRKWLGQIGTSGYDTVRDVAVSGSNDIYFVGLTQADLDGPGPGPFGVGTYDAYIARWDRNGTQKWLRQFGSTGWEGASAVTIRGSSEIYVAGNTLDHATDLDGAGPAPFGNGDGFVSRWDKNGNQQWLQQFGSTELDYVQDLGSTTSSTSTSPASPTAISTEQAPAPSVAATALSAASPVPAYPCGTATWARPRRTR
jgi:hypothetical protein